MISSLPLFLALLATTSTAFDPSMEWSCHDHSISITLRTTTPFEGLITPTGTHTPSCQFLGNHSLVTNVEIDFNSRCGLSVKGEIVTVMLEVHEHRLLILEKDRIFNVSCSKHSLIRIGDDSGSRLVDHLGEGDGNGTSSVDFIIGLEPVDTPSTTDLHRENIVYGQAYDLVATLKPNEVFDSKFKIFNCYITSAKSDARVKLIDEKGCSVDKNIISEFAYETDRATANIKSMFRFRDSNQMIFNCSLKVCNTAYCQPTCNRLLDQPINDMEDYALIARLMGVVSAEETDLNDLPVVDEQSDAHAQTVIHVVEREAPQCVPEVLSTPIDNSFGNVLFVAAVAGLSLVVTVLFVIIVFCWCRCPEKKEQVKNGSYWIHGEDFYQYQETTQNPVCVFGSPTANYKDPSNTMMSFKQQPTLQRIPHRNAPAPPAPAHGSGYCNKTFSVASKASTKSGSSSVHSKDTKCDAVRHSRHSGNDIEMAALSPRTQTVDADDICSKTMC